MSSGMDHSRMVAVLFCDLVGSAELKGRLGMNQYATLLARHDELFNRLIRDVAQAEVLKDTGDGFFAAFATASDAVRFALRFQLAVNREPWGDVALRSRVGIHVGELAVM